MESSSKHFDIPEELNNLSEELISEAKETFE